VFDAAQSYVLSSAIIRSLDNTPSILPIADLMNRVRSDSSHNRLLAALSPRARRRLLAECEKVPLENFIQIGKPGLHAEHAYFPLAGFVSQVVRLDDGNQLELGMIGDEGMLGTALVLGHPQSFEGSAVQAPGTAWRIGAKALQRQLVNDPTMQRMLYRYAYMLMGQVAQTAACVHFHEVEPRLAGWLLSIRDRCHSDCFPVTHELLAYMLAVRRAGITRAASTLKARGLIHYHRGALQVIHARALEAASCGCYRQAKTRYESMLAA
jgi:CRP-like cAMP-binding protein